MKTIIVNGSPQVGKSVFAEYCGHHLNNFAVISTVDWVKQMAGHMGWDGSKEPEDRRFLSDLKDAAARWRDIPYQRTVDFLRNAAFIDEEKGTDTYVFVMCREPDEIERFVKDFGAITVRLERKEIENQIPSNHADAGVFDYYYNYIVENNGTLDDLAESAETFIKELKECWING